MPAFPPPVPIIIKLADTLGYSLRQKAAEHLAAHPNKTGAERGSLKQQGFGALAEIVIRNQLGMPDINPANHPVGHDLLLPSGVKVDVKCRGGKKPFQGKYDCDDGLPREAKHNFFARQLHAPSLDADIYLMTHFEIAGDGTLPGSERQRKWTLYVCGWVSKERALRDGVYLPRGSLTEQGNTWFVYRGQEIEFYHHHLNGIRAIRDLLTITPADVRKDAEQPGGLHLTTADTIRIIHDLIGRGILSDQHLAVVREAKGIKQTPKPILHPNQYLHLMKWLVGNKLAPKAAIEKAMLGMKEEPFEGI